MLGVLNFEVTKMMSQKENDDRRSLYYAELIYHSKISSRMLKDMDLLNTCDQ